MAEKSHYQKRQRTTTELEADLARAYRLINRQRKHIQELELKVEKFKLLHTPIPPRTNTNYPSRVDFNNRKKIIKTARKRLVVKRKQTAKLSRLNVSLVTLVALVITLIGITLIIRKPNPSRSSYSTIPSAITNIQTEPIQITYNLQNPQFQKSSQLQNIVNEVVTLVAKEELPLTPLSITIINVNTGEYAGYQQHKLRYPASVIKMFWMVYLYAQIEKGIWQEANFSKYLNAMIKNSDNDAASYIFDAITGTKSSQNLAGEEYKIWLKKRYKINHFFQNAGYEKINISQKTFPIPYLNISQPEGADMKMRGNPREPIRNQITTQHVARLLYEIYNNRAVSNSSSLEMAELLKIDSQTRLLKQEDNSEIFNPVVGFFSESIPTKAYYGGKAGWTSTSRQEAAYIATPDNMTAYILVVFGEDSAYAYDWKIFPQISRLVFHHMTNN